MTNESKVLVLMMYFLIALGVVMTYSASAVYADQTFHSATYFFRRQLFYVIIGSFFFFISSGLDPEFLRRHSRLLMVLSIFLLALVFLPFIGHSAGGARRWIRLPLFTFQPVEFVKLSMCVYLADYLTRKMKPILEGSISVFLSPLVLLFLVFALILAQPDLGSCIFLFALMGIMFFLSGIRLRYVVIALACALVLITVFVIAKPYRLRRISAYIDPWADPRGSGFQIIQSFLAFGLGGIHGVGLGESTQKLFYLPQSYTDFIFSIVGEELGLIGALVMIACYAVFFFFGSRMIRRLQDPFSKLLAYSLVMLVTLQALINLLVAVGLVPTKGLPLPFVSYGGTALIFNMAAVGLLVAIDKASMRYSSR